MNPYVLILYSFLSETPRPLSARGSRSLLAPTPMSGLFEPHLERGRRALLSSHRCLHPIEHDDKSCFSFTVCLFFFLRSANTADMLYTEPPRFSSLVRRRQRFRIRRACQQQNPSGLHSCLVATGFLISAPISSYMTACYGARSSGVHTINLVLPNPR